MMELAKLAIFLFLWACYMTAVTGWLCGNDGQCICDTDRSVACYDALSCPVFPVKVRYGRFLLLHVASEKFDLASLEWSYGFEIVKLFGASHTQCKIAKSAFDWIHCTGTAVEFSSAKPAENDYDYSVSASKITMSKTTTTSKNGGHEHSDLKETGGVNWLVIVVTIGGAIVAITMICMLVSLVNLHNRLNLRTRSEDDPSYAILCCMGCMGLCLAPFHLCAKICNCNWRGVRDLDHEMRIL